MEMYSFPQVVLLGNLTPNARLHLLPEAGATQERRL
jgi:hypothetical protein